MTDNERLILLARAMRDLLKALSETSCWYEDTECDYTHWPFVHAAEHAVDKILDEVNDG